MLLSSRSAQRSTFERTGKLSCSHESEISQFASEIRQGGGLETCAERDKYTWTTVTLVWKLPLPIDEAKTMSEQ